jgi:hypothetical protein
VIGTLYCITGAFMAGVFMWSYYGRPNGEGMLDRLRRRMPERMKSIDDGPVGKSVRELARSAEVAIPEHEGLQNLAAGLKKQFNPNSKPAGSAPSRSD